MLALKEGNCWENLGAVGGGTMIHLVPAPHTMKVTASGLPCWTYTAYRYKDVSRKILPSNSSPNSNRGQKVE